MKKYEFTNETKQVGDHTLYRIRALRDFGNVKAGDLGGFIEKEDNLSHEGNCWVAGDAMVYKNAHVCDNALVYDKAKATGYAKIYENARVYGSAHVSDDAKVYGNAEVSGDAQVYGNIDISGDTKIDRIYKKTIVTDVMEKLIFITA